jgi:spoIIIJ-associated protein
MPGGNASLESSAKTVEEAIEHGLSVMGLTREEVEVEILNKGSRGVFGLGAEDAIVRLTAKETTTHVEAKADLNATVEPHPVASAATDPSGAAAEETSLEALAAPMLEELLNQMNVQARVDSRLGTDLVEEGDQPSLVLNIQGDDLGILIGRRGETLGALQYMLRLMLSKKLERWEPVIVDVESYRVRRRRSLRQLALRMAERVAFSRQKVTLEAMPAYERRIIHLALHNHASVVTQSVGEGQSRKVSILPK